MPTPTDPKEKNPNVKVFIVLTPAGKDVKIRAESFSISGDGRVINFTANNSVVATFPVAGVTGVTMQNALVRDISATRMEEKINEAPINYVVGVSWPRSGHHLLTRLLQGYIGPRFVYCPTYSKAKGQNFKSDCCNNSLCPNRGEVHYCKNHDFKWVVPKVPGTRYLIQYREFLPSVVSNFELHIRNGNEDTADSFKKFSQPQAKNYRRFLEKWIQSKDTDIEKLVVRYEDLVKDTEGVLVKVLTFFGLGENINRERLRGLIETAEKIHVAGKGVEKIKDHGVKDARKIEDFRYYSPEWFSQLDKLVRVA